MREPTSKLRLLALGLLVAALALALSACGGGGGGDADGGDGTEPVEPAGATLELSGSEFAFAPSTLEAPADAEVTLSFTNTGTIEHDLTIDEANLVVAVTPGQTASGSFTLSAGTYTFYCSVPGHREAGMEGTLTVS